MNTSNVIRSLNTRVRTAPNVSLKSRASDAWRGLTHRLFAEPVVGNLLHEAWIANGEPLERVTPGELAKSGTSRHLVVPHSRGR